MVSRELVVAALNHLPINRIPRDLWTSAAVKLSWREEVAELGLRYPSDIIRPKFHYSRGDREKGKPSIGGRHTDAWGCTWEAVSKEAAHRVYNRPLADGGRIASYEPPLEIFKGARWGPVNRDCAATKRFVLATTQTCPLRRLCLLRGSKAAYADLAADRPRIRNLLEKLHDFSCKEMELWAESDVDGVMLSEDFAMGDPADEDLGVGESTPIALQPWREMFRPLLHEYCKILHAKDKFVFLSIRGNATRFLPDLVKVGVDAVHLHSPPAKFEKLAERFHGRVTFWSEVDEEVMRGDSREDICEAVRRIRGPLDFGSGGLIARCNWHRDIAPNNVATLFDSWTRRLAMHV